MLEFRTVPLTDEALVEALSEEWTDLPVIANNLLANGTPATASAVLALLSDFVRNTSDIEQCGSTWRIRPADVPPLPVGLHHKCGLKLMRRLPNASVHLALCDLPYNFSRCPTDIKLDLHEWFDHLRRVVHPTGAIVMFGSQPFTTDLIVAGRDMFKQSLVWQKHRPTGYLQAHARHLKIHEDILIFSPSGTILPTSPRRMTYNPQGVTTVDRITKSFNTSYMSATVTGEGTAYRGLAKCPTSVLKFPKDDGPHPFAKPVPLLEYLIRTFSNEGDVVLDPTAGSGSTAIAAGNTGRRWIAAELNDTYFRIARDRISRT